MKKVIPVILAGGTGSRLWPLSRNKYPKQFYHLVDERYTMLQQTCLRTQKFSDYNPVVVCNNSHRFIVSEQLHEIGIKNADILLEPVGRDSAAGICVAVHHVNQKYGSDAIVVILSADHFIKDLDGFNRSINTAIEAAQSSKLIVFGVKPSYPEVGYGYINAEITGLSDVFSVKSFKEKPDLELAEKYIQTEDYFWNSGMFVFSVQTLLSELTTYAEDIVNHTYDALARSVKDLDFIRLESDSFVASPKISIDYALMEKSDHVFMIPLESDWSDVGTWQSLWKTLAKDENDNAVKGYAILENSKNNMVVSPDKNIVLLGIKNTVVVDTKDTVLVADINNPQAVKTLVDKLKTNAETVALTELHRQVYRPWGHYDSIENGERYQVKRITVKPGEKLSVQMHHHRAEHWIVVSGTAKVKIDNQERLVTENESVYIPLGAVHSLENPGKINLELIEVQSGSYLGEDDIVRFEDKYGRGLE